MCLGLYIIRVRVMAGLPVQRCAMHGSVTRPVSWDRATEEAPEFRLGLGQGMGLVGQGWCATLRELWGSYPEAVGQLERSCRGAAGEVRRWWVLESAVLDIHECTGLPKTY